MEGKRNFWITYKKLTIPEELNLEGENLLCWWAKQTERFHLLSAVARSVLATPASQAVLERDFCFDGMIDTNHRVRLESIILGMAMTARSNYHNLPSLRLITDVVTRANFKSMLPKIYVDPFSAINKRSDVCNEVIESDSSADSMDDESM
eukprot:scaffold5597_cov159-Ochromonas_danica.AAC.5